MNVNYKKTLKLVTLLATSLLIATVAAETYRYMYIDGSINITNAKMLWILGGDAPTGTTITGSTVSMTLNVENGTLLNLTDVLFLKNANSTGSFNIQLSITTALSASDFDTANIHIYSNSTGTWIFVDTLTLTNVADTYSGSLDAGNYLRMSYEIQAKPEASGSKPFDIQVRYN